MPPEMGQPPVPGDDLTRGSARSIGAGTHRRGGEGPDGGGAPWSVRPDGQCGAPTGHIPAMAPLLSADFADELRTARRRVAVLEEANRAIQESIDRITRLSSFSEGLDRSVDVGDVTELLFEEVRGILPQEVMLLAVVESDGQDFRPLKVHPPELLALARRELDAQLASGMVGWAIGLRRPTMVLPVHLKTNLVLVPLATARRAVGMLMVGTTLNADAIEQQHLTLAAVVARQAAECIDNLRLAEDIRRQHEAGRVAAEEAAARRLADLGLLVETADAVSAALERDEALRILVDATCRHLGIRTVLVSLLDADGRLATAYSAGLPTRDPHDGCGCATHVCPLEIVARTREPLAVLCAGEDDRARECGLIRDCGAVSFLAVPLIARDRIVGVLSVMSEMSRDFSAEETALLKGLAAQGASAIENARLFSEVQGRMEQQQQSLARLVQSAHLASVGLLAGGVAHDINNPLCIISNHLQLLRLRREQVSPEIQSALDSIETSVQRIAGSIEALLEYARVRPGDRLRVDINETLRRVLTLLQYHPLCRRISVLTTFAPDLPPVQLDRAAWEQVVLELVTNAREAMADGGQVHIRTRALDPRPTRGAAAVLPWVEVSVEDEGPGIPPDELARVFDPFFTTKSAKQGMGIGLKICRDIVQGHGGTLRVERGVPLGTRIVIELPTSPVDTPDHGAPDGGENGPRGRATEGSGAAQ